MSSVYPVGCTTKVREASSVYLYVSVVKTRKFMFVSIKLCMCMCSLGPYEEGYMLK